MATVTNDKLKWGYDFEYVAECWNDLCCTKGKFLLFKTQYVLSKKIMIKCPVCGWPASLGSGIRELKNDD